jgi:Holliday junction DNA helicase RuvB
MLKTPGTKQRGNRLGSGFSLQEAMTQPVGPVQIPNDLFSIVENMEDLKILFKRSLESPEPVHVLLHGVPGSAKSTFLLELGRLPGAKYGLGSTSSKAGLRQVLMELQPRYLLIDELDKISSTMDYAVLLSVMESGIVTKDLFNGHEEVHLATWVFAAANRIKKIPEELLSRFVCLRIKKYSVKEFIQVARNVLVDREGYDDQYALEVAAQVVKNLNSRDIRTAIQVARLAGGREKQIPLIIGVLKKRS